MPLLYYWEREQFLLDNQDPITEADLSLAQDSPTLRDSGPQRMWVFTRDCNGTYVLAAQLHIASITRAEGTNWAFTAVPTPGSTVRYRLVNPIVDAEPAIRSLALDNTAKVLGNNFTGHSAVRRVTTADDAILEAFAQGLKHATPGLKWRLGAC